MENHDDCVRDSREKDFSSVKALKPQLKHSNDVNGHISLLPDDTILFEDEKDSVATKLDSLYDCDPVDSISQDLIDVVISKTDVTHKLNHKLIRFSKEYYSGLKSFSKNKKGI